MSKETPIIFMVRAALAKGATEEAAIVLKDGNDAEVMTGNLMIARYFRSRRLLPRAVDYYRAAMLAAPAGPIPELYADLAKVFLSMKCYHDALLFSEEGVGHFPDSVDLWLLRALSLLYVDRGIEARDAFSRAMKLPLDTDQSELCAEVLRKFVNLPADGCKGVPMRYSELLEAYAALSHLPDVARLVAERAVKHGDHALAIEAFKAALAGFPDGARKRAVAGRLHDLTGDSQQADGIVGQGTLASPAVHKEFTVAAITNVYNEKHNMPVWLGHYGRQVGIRNCVVLDHGSDDGSTDDMGGAGVVRLARGKIYDERHRMNLVNSFANGLLGYYDAVIYSDCDEMFVADPEKYENIVDYVRAKQKPVSFAIGLNVRHNPQNEADLHNDAPILSQRSLVQFVSPMCKPLLITSPISWGGGFHCCEKEPSFDDAYLFHLRHADMRRALDRLKTTREIKFAREGGGKHHRRDEGELVEKSFMSVAKMPVKDDFDFSRETAIHKENIGLSFSGRYAVQKSVNAKHLNRVPLRFSDVF
ncbi:hypothetical protein PY32053_01633 [Paracoccus yeei]|uniref:Uncharacterized protein n=1 Tax=Paracoccus yeei TaxID=147645 RepID=A0A386UMB2_9RHOB|nr:glycosyltransferase family 2 protein [Paracoccus yeei]AYF01260.1 hypothetical protein PY32053_01633 [Paracoccus yeei]